MINLIKKNKVFSLALLASVVSGLAFIYGIGFLKMVKSVDPLPERLRNQTFPIWDHQPLAKHGFLVFCTAQDFGNRIAYPGHAPIYLLAMYQFYKIEILNMTGNLSSVRRSFGRRGLIGKPSNKAKSISTLGPI